MHAVVAGDTQVFDADGWSARLGVERRDIGTGMDRTEVAALAGSIDLAALRVYRAAVGAATRAYVEGLGASDLDRIVGPEGVERAREQGRSGHGRRGSGTSGRERPWGSSSAGTS